MRICDHCTAVCPECERVSVALVGRDGACVREPGPNDPAPDLCPKCRETAMQRLLRAFPPPERCEAAAGAAS